MLDVDFVLDKLHRQHDCICRCSVRSASPVRTVSRQKRLADFTQPHESCKSVMHNHCIVISMFSLAPEGGIFFGVFSNGAMKL